MKWLSPDHQPFELCGFPFFSRDHVYRRVQVNPPEPLPKEVDFLANQTAGGQIRFRAVLETLDIRVRLNAEPEMDHMPATGEGGFDCYISEGTDEPLYVSTARLEERGREYTAKWTRHDMTDSNPPATASPCGIWISTETAGAATSVRFKGTGADFFYLKQPGGGVFTIEADGCETIRVDTSSDRLETGKASLRGMEAGKTNTVKLVAQSGKVTLQGFVQKGNECMEGVVHNWGNAAANSKQFAAIDETLFKTALKELDPDYVVILLGTNDGFAASAEVRYLSTIVQRVQSALPDAHILLTSTFDVDLPIPRQSMATYLTDGYPVVARNTGCAYWNMHDWFGPFDASRMLDACHCNDAGGRAIAEEMLKQLRALG